MSITLSLLILWFLHPISVIRSLFQRLTKSIPVFNIDTRNWFKDWRKIRIVGCIAGIFLVIYIVVIIIFGWTYRSYVGLLILQTALFIILDRYLISVNYSKDYWKNNLASNSKFLFTIILSYFYIIVRVMYLLYCFCTIPVLFVAQTGFTVDTFVYGIYGEIVNDSNLLENHTPFGTQINYCDGLTTAYSSKTYFDGKLKLYWDSSDPQNIYLFVSKLELFMKYVNPYDNMIYYGVDPDSLQYNVNRNILYLDADNNNNYRNRIEYKNGDFYLEYSSKHFHYDSGKIIDITKRIKL